MIIRWKRGSFKCNMCDKKLGFFTEKYIQEVNDEEKFLCKDCNEKIENEAEKILKKELAEKRKVIDTKLKKIEKEEDDYGIEHYDEDDIDVSSFTTQETQSSTERFLLREFNKLGLYPETQYPISLMHVDFAFPDDNVVVEVDGPHHRQEEQRLRDKRRGCVLRSEGWSVWRYRAESVYNDSGAVAKRIKKRLEKRRNNF